MSRDLHYLQLWTLSMRAKIKLDPLAVLRHSSLQAENTGNGLRKFNILNNQDLYCDWVLLDQIWIEKLTSRDEGIQEFIILSEIDSNDSAPHGNVFNAMMVAYNDGIAKRAGLGQILDEKMERTDVEWKEFLLA